MKYMVRIAAITSLCILWSRADEIVVPSDRATQTGNGFILDPFEAPGTIDDVYGARSFSGPVLVTGIAFRQDEAAAGASVDAVIPRVSIRMSTYSGTYSSYQVGPGYNGNKGSDDTKVFDASIHWVTTDLPGSGPNPFDLKVLFSTPFYYDPAKGALLVDFITSGAFTSGIHPDSHFTGDTSIGWFGDKTAGNLVTQFEITAVPEPMTGWILLFGGLVYFATRGRSFRL